ncbi:MAG TPA: hypothetical protein DDZ67_05885 [Xanthomonadaceae bacterium]|nr:hypothetical protein [Xanthomonadaceae bacterium]
MRLETAHWAIFFALLGVPLVLCLLINWVAVRAARRPRPPADPSRMPVDLRFAAGYLPYTGLPALGLLVLAVIASGPMAAAAGFAAMMLAALFALLQLFILRLRVRPGDWVRFHAGCLLITLGNLLAVPAVLAGVATMLR